MLYQFVVVPIAAVLLLAGGVWVARQSGRVGRWRPAAITGGLAAAAVGAWLLYAAGVDAWRVGTVTPEQIEGVVRQGMTEANGEPPA